MIKQEFLFGLTVFHKRINVGTPDEKSAFVYQMVANGLDKPISGNSFDALDAAIEAAADAFVNVLDAPGVEDPSKKQRSFLNVCANCKDDITED